MYFSSYLLPVLRSIINCACSILYSEENMCYYNKVRELIAVNVLHNPLLNTTVVAFKVLPLGSYAPTPGPSSPFKTILELVLWNCLQSCPCITPDVINVIKSFPSNFSFVFGNRKKLSGARSGEKAGCSNTVICLVAKNSFTDSPCEQVHFRDARSMSCWQKFWVVSV